MKSRRILKSREYMSRSSNKLRGSVAALLIALVVVAGGCGGGSSGGTQERKVELLANSAYTPWNSGSIGFSVSPPLKDGETLSCSVNDAPAVDCRKSPSTGRAPYADALPGSNVLKVSISGQGAVAAQYSLSWQLKQPDVLVMGATPAGIAASVAAARQGKYVVLLESSRWIGGMMSGGLSRTDVGAQGNGVIGGIAREFFDRARDIEEENGACTSTAACASYFDFEPKVALAAFSGLIADHTTIHLNTGVALEQVEVQGTAITKVWTSRGALSAKVFIDATYEGDLAAQAGVTMTREREARITVSPTSSAYGLMEDTAGSGNYVPPYGVFVDPYVVPGDASSGPIALVESNSEPLLRTGSGDSRLMAYNYRICVTDDPSNRIPFERPADYDPKRYEGSARLALAMAASGRLDPGSTLYFNPAPTVRSKDRKYFKYDLNGGSAFSTDLTMPGWNQGYPEAGPVERAAIEASYRSHIQGLLYAWRTDPRFGNLNAKVNSFGLCADEFSDNNHWPYSLYRRETRRMVGEYVMNENDLVRNGRRAAVTDGVGMAAYGMDSHVRQIRVARISIEGSPPRDSVVVEGFKIVRLPGNAPYPVSYRSLLPRRGEITNLLNPVTLSSTSVAYSSIRMEPTFMILGQSAGTAAALAVDTGVAVQDLDVARLRAVLTQGGQILK